MIDSRSQQIILLFASGISIFSTHNKTHITNQRRDSCRIRFCIFQQGRISQPMSQQPLIHNLRFKQIDRLFLIFCVTQNGRAAVSDTHFVSNYKNVSMYAYKMSCASAHV
jgi:hypothetical protein